LIRLVIAFPRTKRSSNRKVGAFFERVNVAQVMLLPSGSNCKGLVLNENRPTIEREDNLMLTPKPRDEGTGYEMRKPTIKSDLVEVGRGTPMGELLRRYWHPVGLCKDAETARKVRALGEDLILFRDREGRPGLLHARCCHRGTTLYYGKVEPRGDSMLLSRLAV
jgi:Rieske 2Fe-2S protein